MLRDEEDAADVFAVPDLWKPSEWLHEPDSGHLISPFFSPEAQFNDIPFTGPHEDLSLSLDGFFKLPPFLDLLPVEGPAEKEPRLDNDIKPSDAEDGSWAWDTWLRDERLVPPPAYRTWQSFDGTDVDEPASQFLTEAGPEAYDSYLASRDNPCNISSNDKYETIHPNGYCACLLALALGRGSVLFCWAAEKGSFMPVVDLMKVPGYSGHVLQGINNTSLECGNASRFLRQFVDKTYSTNTTPARVALANAVDKLLLVIQAEIGVRGRVVSSLLQLQAVLRPVHTILAYFKSLVARLSKSLTDEQLISILFEEAQSAEFTQESLRQTIREVLKLVSRPWTDFVEEWIGLASEKGIQLTKDRPGKSFVKVEKRFWVDDLGFELEEPDFFLDEEKMPTFIPADVSQSIFETGRNLRFLKSNHPDHGLSHPDTLAAGDAPKLQWHFDWDSITQVERKAATYEDDLRRALRELDTADKSKRRQISASNTGCHFTGYELQIFGQDEAKIEERVLASIAELNNQPVNKHAEEDGLAVTLRDQLFHGIISGVETGDADFSPHWSLLPLLSFGPIVAAQARLVNRECLKLLFKAHNLREHIRLQRQFHLLGSGVFCSRLSHALFDLDLDTAERQAGVALSGGVMGLRLSGRDTWPPASSEMRLALMGVLSESYEPEDAATGRTDGARPVTADQHGLPGEMSFAVRDLSPDEIEQCMDPDSIEALDFLRLSYKPSSPLVSVMAPAVLAKYDRVFKLLLRVLRMLYVVNQLFRDVGARGGSRWRGPEDAALRFRIEAHHFVSSVAAYFFDTGIAMPWRRFESLLDQVESSLEEDGDRAAAQLRTTHSPDRLREYQEQTLDDIMSVLLLRKRQQPVLKLLEDIFRVILLFAKRARVLAHRGTSAPEGDDAAVEMRSLYDSFRKKVEVFITVCRGMSEKSSQPSRTALAGVGDRERGERRRGDGVEENTVVQLLLKLDLTGYYTKGAAQW